MQLCQLSDVEQISQPSKNKNQLKMSKTSIFVTTENAKFNQKPSKLKTQYLKSKL